ncbi:MAG: hypothetical protein HGB23_09925 [Chlorobiaceae bacterium]|nr:hypothetical protein [Chlorobiaceae bacterium]
MAVMMSLVALSIDTMLPALAPAIGQSYNGTVIPLTTGFFILTLLSLGTMQWAEKDRCVS